MGLDNPEIADRVEAFALLLELVDANPHTARAYRGAAETIRGAMIPSPSSCGLDARELCGIGAGIEARLRELVETGELAPDPVSSASALPRAWREALDQTSAGARRPQRGGASRGGGRVPAAGRAGYRAEDRGAAP